MIKTSPIINKLSNKTATKKRRLFETVRDKIIVDMLSANLQPGDNYATEEKLCQHLQASRNTVRKAMAELEQAGFLVRRQRVGAIVTEKACTGRLNAVSFDKSTEPRSTSKLTLVLPVWENKTGNFFSNVVLRELSTAHDGQQKYLVEVRLADDPLDDISGDTRAILAVDPPQTAIPALKQWHDRRVEIIAIEPKFPFFMAVNIRFDAYRAAYDAVKMFHDAGHHQIGLVNQDLYHDTFRQWLLGYLDAHRDLKLAIPSNALIQTAVGAGQPQINPCGITAWLSSYNGGVDEVAEACSHCGLKIPRDVALVCGDDPGNVIIPSIGCSLTAVRPDYVALSKMLRQILNHEIPTDAGSILTSPMQWIRRDSA
ncbi:MAG: substrate-binding domain-containing protein [Victivallaceae bacterium]|jgi:DNA-binding LacI/PurR family transcriptional regulator